MKWTWENCELSSLTPGTVTTRPSNESPPSCGRLAEWASVLDDNPTLAIELAHASHARIEATVSQLDDDAVRRPSSLPDWTLGHVLSHLARNAEGHVRRLEGALRGEDIPRYPGGTAERDAGIAAGATRSARAIASDLKEMNRAIERAWDKCLSAGWPHSDFMGGDHWPTTASPVRRLREVEMHHVDLGLGYAPSDWPDPYVEWELPQLLGTLPARLATAQDRAELVAWLSGRRAGPPLVDLAPW